MFLVFLRNVLCDASETVNSFWEPIGWIKEQNLLTACIMLGLIIWVQFSFGTCAGDEQSAVCQNSVVVARPRHTLLASAILYPNVNYIPIVPKRMAAGSVPAHTSLVYLFIKPWVDDGYRIDCYEG